jgi:hypothetical protein
MAVGLRQEGGLKKMQFLLADEEMANLKRLALIEPIGAYSLYDDDKRIEELTPEEHFIVDFGDAFLTPRSR